MLKIQSKKLDTVAVLSLQGQLVNGETELLRDAVGSLASVSALKLDLARVTMVDAGGLGVMLALREQAEANGVRFELMNLTEQIGKVFEITRLDSVFRITSGVEFFRAASRGSRAAAAPLRSCA
jgi:anti-anti-sigma factor